MATVSPLHERVQAVARSRGIGHSGGEFHWQHRDSEGVQRFDEGLAKFLGAFSVGLGLAEVIAPKAFCRFIGLRGDRTDRTIVRLFGLRELAAAGLVLAQRRPATGLWSRVAGDTMDLAALGAAMASGVPEPERTGAAIAAVAGVTAMDLYGAIKMSRYPERGTTLREARKAITTIKSPAEVYSFWRNFENLPRFMSHLESVEDLGNGHTRWTARAPLFGSVSWEAETTEDVPNERISWRSVPGSSVATDGTVRFVPAPGNRGTEIHVHIRYNPPAGALGALVAKLAGEAPDEQLQDDLRILRQVLETGMVVISDSGAGDRVAQRPAQPIGRDGQ